MPFPQPHRNLYGQDAARQLWVSSGLQDRGGAPVGAAA